MVRDAQGLVIQLDLISKVYKVLVGQGGRVLALKGGNSMVEVARQKVKDIPARVCLSDLMSPSK